MSDKTQKKKKVKHPFNWLSMLMLTTIFQLISMMPVVFLTEEPNVEVVSVFGGFILVQWLYFICARNFASQRATELEIIAFALSGIGLVTVASVKPEYALKQFIAILIGLAAFIVLVAIMRNVEVISALRIPVAMHNVPEEKIRKVIIAYEPIWAIGTGLTATPEQAEEVCEMIRSVVRKLYSSKNARAISILYGGSMNEKNAFELLAQPDIDGGLIGGASLVPEKFVKIIEAANQPTV